MGDAVEIRDGLGAEEPVAVAAHGILADLVAGGAALGWVEPPSRAEMN